MYSSGGIGILKESNIFFIFIDKFPSDTDLIACIGIINRAIELSLYIIPNNTGKLYC